MDWEDEQLPSNEPEMDSLDEMYEEEMDEFSGVEGIDNYDDWN